MLVFSRCCIGARMVMRCQYSILLNTGNESRSKGTKARVLKMVNETKSTRRRRHRGDRRKALRSATGESKLTLLKGVSSSSITGASSLENVYESDKEEPTLDRRTELVKGESRTKLLQGISSSETTSSSITRQNTDKPRIMARAASLLPTRNAVEKKKKKQRPQEKLDTVVTPSLSTFHRIRTCHFTSLVNNRQPPEVI